MTLFINPRNYSKTALIDAATGTAWTHADLARDAAELAAALPDPGGLAFCFCDNGVRSIINYLACAESGLAVALLDIKLATETKERLISQYYPDAILSAGDEEPLPGYEPVAVNGGARVLRRASAGEPVHPDLCVLLSTSGTTGSPRFAKLSRENLVSNAESIAKALRIGTNDRAVASLPLHYSYGMSIVNSNIMAGASIVVPRSGLMSPEFWADIRSAEGTTFAGVPYSYEVLKRLDLTALNVPSLVKFTQAGGKLSDELALAFHRKITEQGGEFYVMYGQTEASPRITTLPSEWLPEKLGSAGPALAGGRLEILTDSGDVAESPDVEGELVYTGPNVMMGYAVSRADLSLGDQLGGVLHTGDVCRLDSDGCLYVIGRRKRDAKVLGLRINLDEVESLVRHRGPIAAVAGNDTLVLYCAFGSATDLAAVRLDLATQLRINQHAIEVNRIDILPTTTSGKTDYKALVRGKS